MRSVSIAAVVATLALALVRPAAAETTPAGGQWVKLDIPTVTQNDMVTVFHALSPLEWFVGGLSIDMQNPLNMGSFLYWTQDGGKLMKPLNQGLGGNLMSMATLSSLSMTSWNHGLLAAGDKLYVRDSALTSGAWKALPGSPEKPAFVHLIDPMSGVANVVGGQAFWTNDGGATWNPAEVDAFEGEPGPFFFSDSRTGWFAAVKSRDEETNDGSGSGATLTYYGTQTLLQTKDGGKHWSIVWQEEPPAEEKGGRTAGRLFFLRDGQTGFMTNSSWDEANGRAYPAHVLKTQDGGRTWRDLNVPVEVGTFDMMGFSMPVYVSYFQVQWWDDARNGHLAGSAYVAEQSSGGGSSTPPLVKNVDFVTRDGGLTWTRTELGTIAMSGIGGGGTGAPGPATDGRPIAGQMRSFFEGWMAGESGNIYAYSFKCIKDSQCGPGYDCRKPSETEEPRCYALDPVPGDNGGGDDVPGIGNDSGPPAGDLASASCEPGFVACDGNRRMSCQDDGTWAFAENCAATGATCSSGACVGGGNSGGGCSAAPIGTSAPWLLMLALMAGIAAIRRPPA